MGRYFENNKIDGIETVDAIMQLHDITSVISANAIVNAAGDAELDEKDAAMWWTTIALAEAALAGYPDELVEKGFDLVNRRVDRDLAEAALRDEAKEIARRFMRDVFGAEED